MGKRKRQRNRDATGAGSSVAGKSGLLGTETAPMSPDVRKFETILRDANEWRRWNSDARQFDAQIAAMAALFCLAHFAIRQNNPTGAECDSRVQTARRLWRDARTSAGLHAGNGVIA